MIKSDTIGGLKKKGAANTSVRNLPHIKGDIKKMDIESAARKFLAKR